LLRDLQAPSRGDGQFPAEPFPLEIRMTKKETGGGVRDLLQDGGPARIVFSPTVEKYTIGLRNLAKGTLHAGCIYLSKDFGATVDFLPGGVIVLEEGYEIELDFYLHREPGADYLAFDDYAHQNNWEGYTEYWKFVVCGQSFELQALALDSLPSPSASPENDRAIPEGKERSAPLPLRFDEWLVQTVGVYFVNPAYIPEKDF
jgi:hypothetical protein